MKVIKKYQWLSYISNKLFCFFVFTQIIYRRANKYFITPIFYIFFKLRETKCFYFLRVL